MIDIQNRQSIEEMVPGPVEIDLHLVSFVHHRDVPERLRNEISCDDVTIHDEAKGGKLTRTWRGETSDTEREEKIREIASRFRGRALTIADHTLLQLFVACL